MTDLITAITYTISKFVTMFFSLQIDPGISIGHFFVAAAILGALIRFVFHTVQAPGSGWASRFKAKEDSDE
ncbi:MAG: hypothetical protein HFI38_14000 [Lachnospiraceae bacterium]|jgi:hypothetical protein|nr:hypothetical protein [Lachnospiraceae bacterium]